MKRSVGAFDILSLCLLSACGGGKRECEAPGEFSYEDKKAYSCLAENTSADGTKKVLVFKCSKEDYTPFVYEFKTPAEDGKEDKAFIYTCLDDLGNIDIPKLSTESSLYCSPDKVDTWVRVSYKGFLHRVYFRCPDYVDGEKIPYKYSDAEIADMDLFKAPYRDESLVICPLGERNISESPLEVTCGKQN